MRNVPESLNASLARVFGVLQASAYIPAAVLVGGGALLINTDRNNPDSALTGLAAFTDYSIAALPAAVGLVFLVAVLLEPLQFSFIRWLEGYWSGWLTWPLRRYGLAWQLWRFDRLTGRRRRLKSTAKGLNSSSTAWLKTQRDLELVRNQLSRLPARDRLLPTPLGNRLRYWEDDAGRGLEGGIQQVLPLVFHALPTDLQEQHDYHRGLLDLHCTLFPIWLLLGAWGVVVLDGVNLNSVGLVGGCLAAAAATHRAATTAADGYGRQLVSIRELLAREAIAVGTPQTESKVA